LSVREMLRRVNQAGKNRNPLLQERPLEREKQVHCPPDPVLIRTQALGVFHQIEGAKDHGEAVLKLQVCFHQIRREALFL
jgi:hypothetical protein